MNPPAPVSLLNALGAALKEGPIPFHRYMELALYHPEGGYYCQPAPRIGRGGDFKTSPHQSSWFGRMLARQAEALWDTLEKPDPFTLAEFGPGEGWLAYDLLAAVGAGGENTFGDALHYLLIEQSRPAAGRIADRIERWLEKRPGAPRAELAAALPDAMDGLILAHEFLDALPTHLLVQTREGLKERYVERRDSTLGFTEGPLSDPRLAGWFERLGVRLSVGQTAEVCPAAAEGIESAAARLHRGGILIFDYGFSARVLYGPDRREGTLRGYRNHTLIADVLTHPGETDLTAHVDFTAILQAARAAGLTLAGFTDQCHFLLGLGIAEALAEGGPEEARARRAAMGLLDPAGLGGAIKVMLLAKGFTPGELPAFSMKPDDRESLATLGG
ncbi:MAG: SAM-dependent methyltransferase [bacterium]|nr:SAM-dependent methyltransferase [bacterium]